MRRDAIREYVRGSLWVLPTGGITGTLVTVIALLLALTVVALQRSSITAPRDREGQHADIGRR